MVDIIEERIIIDMYYKKGKLYNQELYDKIAHLLTEDGYRQSGIDYTLENGIKFYFSKENT